jgi:hypothetical protein
MSQSNPKTRIKAPTPLQQHREQACKCSVLVNPNFCSYQPFLDGWDFTPDVGNGQVRGEIFTPRFIVDKMLMDSGILPKKAIYKYDYAGADKTLVKYIGFRVYEPGVGTGNFISTVLWHKMEYANILTKPKNGVKRTDAELARYQAYTLVALGSVYFNDIDIGNLQVTKWRLLRDSEINTPENIQYWENYLIENLEVKTIKKREISQFVKASIVEASSKWGNKDRNRGVMDDLYYDHIGQDSPEWLRKAWKTALDENGKLFNGIVSEDNTEIDSFCPGYRNISWIWWRFDRNKSSITAQRTTVPMARQILESKIATLKSQIQDIEDRKIQPNADDFFLFEEKDFASKEDKKAFLAENKLLATMKKDLKAMKQYEVLEPLTFLRSPAND